MAQLIGHMIGQYQIVECIARGDTALVYKGFQPAMSRYVAVKILPPSRAKDAAAVQAFQRAAETAAQLEHEHILPVYDYGQADDISYLVTQYVEQGTLEARLDRGYTPAEALEILRPIAAALHYAHERGIIHGNLRASNVLLDARERPLLTDFGFGDLARSGTEPAAYLSPEQRSGDPIDRRTDVYGLGLLLYEILVEEPAADGRMPSPRLIRPDLTPAVEKVMLKAMASAPRMRYQTVEDFIRALDEAVAPAPLPPASVPPTGATVDELVEPAPAPLPAGSRRPDRSWLVFLLGAIFVLILAFVIINVLGGGESGATEPPAPVPTEVPPAVQPTTPPEVEPTDAPPPTEEPPPTAEPTTVAPTEDPGDSGAGSGSPGDAIAGVCGSVGASAGVLVLGGVLAARRRPSAM